MIRHFLSVSSLLACLFCLTGCGGDGGYDPETAPPPTQAQLDEAVDYQKQYEEQAAAARPGGTTSPGN